MSLYDHQLALEQGIYGAWANGAVNVIATLPTGGGKTVVMGDMVLRHDAPTCAIAHRQELVSQLSLAFNREGVPHGIVAPKQIVQQIIALHHETHGFSHYKFTAPVRVAGVDTLIRREVDQDRWFKNVSLCITDESHHAQDGNKWGDARNMFPNARGLGLTAHAIRADGEGLGRGQGGQADALVVGPSCRELIARGFLTPYRLLAPPNDIDVSDVPVGATGDFNAVKLRAATHRSRTITGDVVQHYLRYAAGKLGITFAVDIEAAKEFAGAYQKAGISAEVITSKTPLAVRGKLMRMFRNRQLLQLISVDVLGEGVDVPAIEVVSIARRTASFQVWAQQTGRSLRTMLRPEVQAVWHTLSDEQRVAAIAASEKPTALILDHVGNVLDERLGPPDAPQQYSLMRRERGSRGKSDGIPLRICTECIQPYERVLLQCPYCGTVPTPAGRGSPELVDGDLVELDPSTLGTLQREIDKVDGVCHLPQGTPAYIGKAILRNHHERFTAQQTLRHQMAVWGGWQQHLGRSERESQRRFFHAFGVDTLSAQALGKTEAAELEGRIMLALLSANVIEAAE